MKPIPLKGWMPDADPTVPGVLLDCAQMVPTTRGMQTFSNPSTPNPAGAVGAGLTANCRGQNYVEVGGIGGVVVGFDTAVYASWQEPATPWASLASGLPSPGGLGGGIPWRFEAWQQSYMLASHGMGKLKVSLLTGALSDIAASPDTVFTFCIVQGFVMAFNFKDPVSGDSPGDNWYSSARYDHTNWTLSNSTYCVKGRLLDSEGPINGAIEFGGSVYAFKHRKIYQGQFQPSSTDIWVWNPLPVSFGTTYPCAICKDRRGIYFLNETSLYFYNGAEFTDLMQGKVRDLFRSCIVEPLMYTNRAQITVVYDEARDCLFLNFPSLMGQELWAYHIPTGWWGRATKSSYSVLGGNPIPWVGLTASPPTFGVYRAKTIGAFNPADDKFYPLVGTWASLGSEPKPRIVTSWMGDDQVDSELTDIRLRAAVGSLSDAVCTPSHVPALDSAIPPIVEADRTITGDNKFEPRQNDRWHQLKFTLNAHAEISAVSTDLAGRGDRK